MKKVLKKLTRALSTRRRTKPGWQLDIAEERIDILFREAEKVAKAGKLKRANRYIFLARKLGMKFNLKFSKLERRKFCHKCYHYLQPGKNLIVRTNPKTKAVEYKCKDCGKINRYPYSKAR